MMRKLASIKKHKISRHGPILGGVKYIKTQLCQSRFAKGGASHRVGKIHVYEGKIDNFAARYFPEINRELGGRWISRFLNKV